MNTSIENKDMENKKGTQWKFEVLGALARPDAPRIVTSQDFFDFVQKIRPDTSTATAAKLCAMMVTSGAFSKITGGVFINRRISPPVEIAEAANFIRSGAILSLHSVLGECGFLNNPSATLTCVLPVSNTKRPTLGEVTTSGGIRFHFLGLSEKFFPNNEEEKWEMLQPGRKAPTFRPEAALLHWLHLANMQRSNMVMPPIDVDMEVLDKELLNKLATKWNLSVVLNRWMKNAIEKNFGEESEIKTPAINNGDAKARLLAKFKR